MLVFYRANISTLSVTQSLAHYDHGTSDQVFDMLYTILRHRVFFLVYKSGGYLEAVDTCTKLSMARAVSEVKAGPEYSTSGEVQ